MPFQMLHEKQQTTPKIKKFARVELRRGYDGSKESNDPLFASLQESANSVTSRAAPNTLAKRALIVAHWNSMLSQYQPTWPEEIFWHFGVVYDNAKLFLPYLVQNIVPKNKFNKTINQSAT
ncbi:uncharacterized protein LACBIDRAFT_324843 [Laccaria bicolor S238N-H82]|uniref:Predicted protein n=1 Tax=Laccaria bicolor (strain S238N-H82 / ATCC MYA-4686) TaxID=486041 RepID=B0D382_LACBS|nr:uncharacterized protein LACBIDRAFT_324843 [Laccaria bicolor S238N-H82]EDR11236.1 predicted protein [Laccaria bicolor S238N-H82]|eukprot:XP_001878537.1 predicted protein [Laccaria bicolor S238N-H82]